MPVPGHGAPLHRKTNHLPKEETTLQKYPFRKVAVVRNEICVGPLSHDAQEANCVHHYDLIASIVGDDFDVDDSLVSTGWICGEGPNVTVSFATSSGSEAHHQIALKLIEQWAKKEGLRVSFPSAPTE